MNRFGHCGWLAIVRRSNGFGQHGVSRMAKRANTVSEPRARSEPAQRRARAVVGESEGQSPSDKRVDKNESVRALWLVGDRSPLERFRPARRLPNGEASEHRERATRTERAGAAASESGCWGVGGAKPLG